MQQQQVNIFYFYDINNTKFSWERDWLAELFQSTSQIKFNFHWFKPDSLDAESSNVQCTDQTTNVPILILNSSVLDNLKYFRHRPYIVVHLSDEYLTDSVNFYEDQNCLHIFRCYLKPGYLHHPKITYIPLGYKQGMFDDQDHVSGPTVKDRKYFWSFIGCPNKSGRQAILNSLSDYQPNYLHLINYWDAPNSLDSQSMRDLLYQSQVIPCLKGNVNIDTFRLFEALECGCIPIIYKYNEGFSTFNEVEYFREMLGPHPIPVTDNNFQSLIHELSLLSTDQLETKRQEIWHWYQQYKQNLKSHIHQTIERLI